MEAEKSIEPSKEEIAQVQAAVSHLNDLIGNLYEKYEGHVRIYTRAGYSEGDYARVGVEITKVVANIQ